MTIEIQNEIKMEAYGARLGGFLVGGEVIELVGDIGAGKTRLTKGIATGLGVSDDVQSPSFTISRVYSTPSDLHLAHYDFYRLYDAGIMTNELQEAIHDPKVITVIEWAKIVSGVLPADRLTISVTSPTEHTRCIKLAAGGKSSQKLLERLA
jgi:tRNA threonylcarbamoyladenosine biosynthesis protein TsaE